MRWGIPVFIDQKRKVIQHPVVGFLLSLLEIIGSGYRDSAVMQLIKSGFLGLAEEEQDALENYVQQFKIRGTLWKKPFSRMGDNYTAEDLNRFNELREQVVSVIETARDRIGKYNTAGEKIRGLYGFLSDDFMMEDRIEAMAKAQQEAGFLDGAAETGQSWNGDLSYFRSDRGNGRRRTAFGQGSATDRRSGTCRNGDRDRSGKSG